MNSYVVDTHALFWYLSSSPRLGANAKAVFDEGVAGRATIFIPAIVLAELFFLNQKVGRPLDFRSELDRLVRSGQFRLVPFLPEDTTDFDVDVRVPEMHDRMITGVARRESATCITKDLEIVSSGIVATVW